MGDEHYAFVLVVDEKYWNRLSQTSLQGKQINFFVRKSKAGPTDAKKLLFYIKKKKQIRGTADFVERVTGDVETLWKKHGGESFFESFKEYETFAEGRKVMTFIRFKNFTEIASPRSKEAVTSILGSLFWFRPRYVSKQTADMLTT